MAGLIQTIERTIVEQRLLEEGETVVVATSGGVDSMVLLHLLHRLARKHRWRLHVAHFNHGLRGRAAEADERFVRQTASVLNLPVHTLKTDIAAIARREKLSIEMAARRERHQFLANVTRQCSGKKMALAHHADDQVELLLLRLLRGAGSSGLGGMPLSSASPADSKLTIIRPLLGVRKPQLIAWAEEENVRFRNDVTNASTEFLRNAVRRKLLPLLRREYQPGIDEVLLRTSELLRDESGFLDAQARQWLRRRRGFDKLAPAVQRRVLQQGLIRAGIAPDFTLIEQLRGNELTWVSAGPDLHCRRDSHANVETRPRSACTFCADERKVALRDCCGTDFGGLRIEWSFHAKRSRPEQRVGCEVFDANAVGDDVVLRHWRRGDRFQPIGMSQAVKLQDLFTNQKIPQERRHTVVVGTTSSGEIFWVEGLRIGERFKLKPSTAQQLGWRWTRG